MNYTHKHTRKMSIPYSILFTCAVIAFFIGAFDLGTGTPQAEAAECKVSDLWNNETGYNTDRLTDFSRAGYMAGEDSIPNNAPQLDVTDFGARGDDEIDDTRAFQEAVRSASGVVYIPEGEYIITEPIRILNDGVVLRGAGKHKTVLKFPDSLKEYCKKEPSDQMCIDELNERKPFSHARGFIQLGDESSSQMVGSPRNIKVVERANRGDFNIVIENADRLQVGQWVVLQMVGNPNSKASLMERLQGGKAAGVNNDSIDDESPRFINKITAITEGANGDTLTLALPLTTDVRFVWSPTISAHETSIANVGIENLKILFPFTVYTKHFMEYGYNAIDISSAKNCWVDNVAILNADNGIIMSRSAFCTLENLLFNDARKLGDTKIDSSLYDNKREDLVKLKELKASLPEILQNKTLRGEYSGHHGVTIAQSSHILMSDSQFNNRFVHDITTTSYANRNVFSNITGFDLNLDHHRRAPHNNLFTEIDAGFGTRIWSSSGVGDGFGPHSGAYNTYWNIKRSKHTGNAVPLPVDNFDNQPKQDFGLKLNFVFNANKTQEAAHKSWLVEDSGTDELCTPNLYEAIKE